MANKPRTVPEQTAIVERKFLLFQLDFSDPKLQEMRSLNPITGQNDSSSFQDSIKLVDPLDYDNPQAPLYWRNILDGDYPEKYKTAITAFQNYLTELINASPSSIRLKTTQSFPFRDISVYVKNVEKYTTTINEFSNTISLDIANSETFITAGVKTDKSSISPESLVETLDIKENDVLMVRVSRDGGETFELEYLGMVTTIVNDTRYGQVNDYNIGVEGISKSFHTTTIVKQGAINQNQFIPNVEVNSSTMPSNYQNKFENKNTGSIFTSMLKDVLGIRRMEGTDGNLPDQVSGYIFDTAMFKGTDGKGFQNNFFVLLTLYLMQAEIRPPVTPGLTDPLSKLFPVTETSFFNFILDSPVRAYLQHGEHKTYNQLIADGYANFFAQLSTPEEIFNDMRGTSFYEIFENRNGTLICRPPRYNKLEVNTSDIDATSNSPDGIFSVFQRVSSASGVVYKFKEGTDFYIGEQDQAEAVEISKDDIQLDTHADVQFMMPMVSSPIDFPSGAYTDPSLLVKYGLRSKGPMNNPNALNTKLAKLYAPIVLGINNAETRKSNVVVWDSRPYRIGKLYYVESENIVGYAISSTIDHTYGAIGKLNLEMVMVRRVIEKDILDILTSDNELLNFAMCYLADIKADLTKDPKGASHLKETLISEAKSILTKLQVADPGAKIQMYRYVPSVMDLITDVEDNPGLAANDVANSTKAQAEIDKQRRLNGMKEALYDPNTGQFYASDLVKKYPQGVFNDVSDALNSNRPDKAMTTAFPGVGIYKYGLFSAGPEFNKSFGLSTIAAWLPGNPGDGSGSVNIVGNLNKDFKNVPAVSSPFYTAQISHNPNSFLFSQLLLNRLAALDLSMKYVYSQRSFRINPEGFPQFYGVVNGAYRLFGSTDAPGDFIKNSYLRGRGSLLAKKDIDIDDFRRDVLNTPNAIPFIDGGFKNNFFSIRPNGGVNRYNLPPGHFIYKVPGGGKDELRFVTVSGGAYTIVPKSNNTSFDITPIRKDSYVEDDIVTTTQRASWAIDVPSIYISEGASTVAPIADPPKSLSITAVNGLYFISPFTDMSLERLMEWGLDPSIAGFRRKGDVEKLLKTTNKALLGDSDLHSKGQGIDICPETLTRGSGSDLEVLQPLYTRLTTLLHNQGFIDSQESLLKIANAIHLDWTYIYHKVGSGSPSSVLSYIHLGVTDTEVKNFITSLRPGVKS